MVGYSYAGKTVFINLYLADQIIFDLKTFYKETKINPTDYQGERYTEYRELLTAALNEKIKEAETKGKNLVIEHSGLNQIVRELRFRYGHLGILVWTPLNIVNERIKKAKEPPKFDVYRLNDAIDLALKEKRIDYDLTFYSSPEYFKSLLDLRLFERRF